MQEFVLCHEVCHLVYKEWDEKRANRLACELFLDRAKSAEDFAERKQFVSNLEANGMSDFAITAAVTATAAGIAAAAGLSAGELAGIIISSITAVAGIATTIYSIVAARNVGWYSWNKTTQQTWLDTALQTSFEAARRSSNRSAKDFFWAQLSPVTNKDESVEEWMNRNANSWVGPVITKYEKRYGFGFDEVRPIDLTAYPLVIVAIGAIVAFVVYRIIKKSRK